MRRTCRTRRSTATSTTLQTRSAWLTRISFALLPLVALGACRNEDRSGSQAPPVPLPSQVPSSSPTHAAPLSEWSDFYGIQYKAPAGTDARITRSVLPGPGGKGGIPTDVRPSAVLSLPGPRGFYVELLKTAEPVSLEGMKRALVGNKVGSHHVGKATKTGWELTYDMINPADGKTGKAHTFYFDVAAGHYQCSYYEVNCGDPAAADAICRSIRPKAGR